MCFCLLLRLATTMRQIFGDSFHCCVPVNSEKESDHIWPFMTAVFNTSGYFDTAAVAVSRLMSARLVLPAFGIAYYLCGYLILFKSEQQTSPYIFVLGIP